MATDHQNNLNDSYKNKRAGQANQPPSKTLQLCRRLRLLFSNERMKFRHKWTLLTVRAISSPVTPDSLNKRLESVSGGVVHKSKNATMPNEKS
jgi:hypothetical protein